MSTKEVFLDIDGVLNGYPFLDEVEANSTAAPLSREWWSEFIDDARVERLNHILEVTGAKVVLSSSWRMRWPYKELQELFEEHGFRGRRAARQARRADRALVAVRALRGLLLRLPRR